MVFPLTDGKIQTGREASRHCTTSKSKVLAGAVVVYHSQKETGRSGFCR